jgi:hypothetical protein
MKEYILINRVPADYSLEDAKSVSALWNVLTDEWKTEGIFVTSFIFPSKGFVISDGGASVVKENIFNNGFKIVSTIILKASSYDELIEKAKKCPILQQQGMVEVVELK